MRAHEAGALHAEGYGGPSLAAPAGRRQRAGAAAVVAPVRRGSSGKLKVGGVDVVALAASSALPRTWSTRRTSAPAPGTSRRLRRAFAAVCGGADVYYAGKAFLCTEVARWVVEEGLNLDVCTGGSSPWRCAPACTRSGWACTATTSPSPRSTGRSVGVGRIVLDSLDEIDRVAAVAARLGVAAACCSGSPSASRRTRTSTWPPRTRTRSSASRSRRRGGGGRRAGAGASDGLDLLGLHSHIGSQIFDSAGFEVAARRLLGLHARSRDEHGVACPSWTSAAASASPTRPSTTR